VQESLNSDVCHTKVIELLRDLDGATASNIIVGHKDSDGFEYRINIERARLYQRLSQVLERNPRLVNIMAFAASRSEYMPWFVKLFERAITYEGQKKRHRQLIFLQTHLGTILSVYAGQYDDAIHHWQNVVDQKQPATRVSEVARLVQEEASKYLSRLCISRASSDVARAEEYIKIVENLDKANIGSMPSQIGTARLQTKIHLATWYYNQGELDKARLLVQDDVLWALDILTDDDPANDFNGFYVLANALRAVQDDPNHLAARHAMRQYDEDDSAMTTADKKQKATNTTNAFCSGLCLQEHKQWDGMWLCRSCPDLNLCRNCYDLFETGDLHLKICNPEHKFLQVPRLTHPFMRGNQVVVHDRVIDLDDWVNELRKQWLVLNKPNAEPTKGWRRLSGNLLASDGVKSEGVKTERKRDKLWRMLSNDKEQK
jgi:tetratricopeptide (TPR) repeat protein